MKEMRISVNDMVKFIHSGGDLTSEFKSNRRALDGTNAHAFLQKQYCEGDQKEVFVETLVEKRGYSIHITGRMDGLRYIDNTLTVEEIKSTTSDLELIEIDTRPDHLAQAKLYAFIYMFNNNIRSIRVRLVYVKTKTFETKDFYKRYNLSQLKRFFENTVNQYIDWLELLETHRKTKMKSIEGLLFPFDEYREGQYLFMGAVYKTIMTNDILYSTAPTGIGKTVAALFSALKTIQTDKDKVFYLTAKNAGKTIAVETVDLMKEKGLKVKTIVLHSKENMCLMDTVDCDPEICPYAKGFFNRVNDALKDIFVHEDVYDRELVLLYAKYHTICPHEFSLTISNFSDIVICDYNYAFDPRTHLIRYFEEEYYNPILLVDEAHNLISRSRNMYSASISLSAIQELKKHVKGLKFSPKTIISKVIQKIMDYANEVQLYKSQFHMKKQPDDTLLSLLEQLSNKLEQILNENKKFPKRKQILDIYFQCIQFLRIYDLYNNSHRYVSEIIKDDVVITIKCLDASMFLLDTIKSHAKGTVFFSATLHPIDYHARLITSGHGKSLVIPSPFPMRHLGLFVDDSTSTRYKDRNRSIGRIIDNLYALLESKIGNYIIFFPSYEYLNLVLKEFDSTNYEVLIQTKNMTYTKRKEMIKRFDNVEDKSKVGFFVLGGSFSEGVDYIGEKLSGVLIIGVALPQFNKHNELLRSYFDRQFENGFDYAYTFPGFNKVIQAVGRVIRSEDDIGVAILMDDRYSHRLYRMMFPNNWQHAITLPKGAYLSDTLKLFWKQWKHENNNQSNKYN